MHPHAHKRHQQVRRRQIHQVLIGGGPHVPVVADHEDDQQVTDQGDEEHDQVSHDLCQGEGGEGLGAGR